MPDFLQLVATLREQMNAELTRTDVLRPLIWPIAGLFLAISTTVICHGPKWLLIALGIALAVMLAAYLVVYGYFAIKDPDSLRSEKYKLHKMAIEHGLIGDSKSGLYKVEQLPPSQTLIDSSPSQSSSHE
jgi:hypothetical protein